MRSLVGSSLRHSDTVAFLCLPRKEDVRFGAVPGGIHNLFADEGEDNVVSLRDSTNHGGDESVIGHRESESPQRSVV